jgi:[acyl-carrier-protein] S-malonyltransferase
MGKIAFIFAGQGAQYVGMGQDLYQQYEVCKEVFDGACESIGLDLKELCFNGPIEELNKTQNTQPAVVTMTLSALAALKAHNITPDVVAGLSLGEYSALVCSGVFDLKTVVPLVKKRGQYMQEAVPVGVGKMIAVLGLDEIKVREVCNQASVKGIVEPANFNCPGQIVIGGENLAVDYAAELAKEMGALKTVELPVSAPFHTSMLSPAAENLSMELENIVLGDMNTPVITNVTGDYINHTDEIKALLKKQVMSSVLWEQTIRKMIDAGVDTFIEIGPGKTLSAFVRKIDRKLTVLNVESVESLNKTIEALGGR